MKTVLTIAGSDPFGGAGMQADIKTMTAHDVYAMTAITLLSAQNSQGFYDLQLTSADLLEAQIDHIFEDVNPDATKTGMLLSEELVNLVADKLHQYKPKNLVIDPIMIAQGKIKLLKDEVEKAIIERLIPIAYVITPNKWETEIISGLKIESKEDMEKATKAIFEKYGVNVLTKSDCLGNDSDDLLYTDQGPFWLPGPKIENKNVRGTGDALSAALASNLAKGYDLRQAASKAKAYVTLALDSKIQVGKGRGPIHNSVGIEGEYPF